MPTEEICDHYDALIQSIQSLLEMKRQMDKLEHELRILQNRKALLLEKSDTLPNDTADTPGEEAPSSSVRLSNYAAHELWLLEKTLYITDE